MADERGALHKDRVLAAAMALADAEGSKALSMRKLAASLGFEVMSLYNHVANKADVLDGITDLVAGEIVLPEPGTPWQDAVRTISESGHRALVAHPWACELWFATGTVGPNRLAYMEALLAALRDAGFSAALAHHGFHAVDQHMVGFSTLEVSVRLAPDEQEVRAEAFIAGLPDGEYPRIVEHVRYHLAHPTDDDDYDFGLDLILRGLEPFLPDA